MTHTMRLRWDPPASTVVFFWLVVAFTVVLVLGVGFFLHGGRLGLYSDDYANKAWAFDFATGGWKLTLKPMRPDFRPLHTTLTPNLTNAIPEHELPVRVGVVLLHLTNVFMLGWLARRLTASCFVAILAGGSFLMPVLANEALLWLAAAVPIAVSQFLLLAGFHCLMSCRASRSPRALVAGGVVAWVAMAQFYETGLFTLLLLPVFIGMMRPPRERPSPKVWMLALAATYAAVGAYLFFVVRTSRSLTERGGVTFDPLSILTDRVPSVASGLVWLAGAWGVAGPLREALELGWREWMSTPQGWILGGGMLLGLWFASLTYPDNQERLPSGGRAMALLPAGLAWAGLALVPIVLVKAQIVEVRTLYTPLAGLALSVAGVWVWIVRTFSRWRTAAVRAALLGTGAIICVSSIAMAGLTRTYQLRWELDQHQLAAFRQAFPDLSKPGRIWLCPVALDERTVSEYWGRPAKLDRYLVGVFEAEWGTSNAVRMAYRRDEVYAVAANRWGRLHVTAVDRSEDGRVHTVTIQGQAVPVDELLAFTYRQGRVIALSPLVLSADDGNTSTRLDLPLVAKLRSPATDVEPARLRVEKPRGRD